MQVIEPILECVIAGIILGSWGWIFSASLIEPGMVFDWWPKLVRFILTGSTDLVKAAPWKEKIFKATFACPKCVSGQFGLWLGWVYVHPYEMPHHILLVMVSIFIGHVLEIHTQK